MAYTERDFPNILKSCKITAFNAFKISASLPLHLCVFKFVRVCVCACYTGIRMSKSDLEYKQLYSLSDKRRQPQIKGKILNN